VNSGAPANRPAESAHAVSSAPRSIGLARSYAELQRIVADYCEHTAITRVELGAEAGIADGNSSKALARRARKRLGWVTLGRVLGAAGLALHVVIDPDAPPRDLNASSSASRERYSRANHWRNVKGPAWGRRLAAKRALKLTATERSAIASKAARARWQRRRLATPEIAPAE
jgi:hypothetical protein